MLLTAESPRGTRGPRLRSRAARSLTRMFDRLRSTSADEVATSAATGSFDSLNGRRHVLLVSYRRDGSAMPTPMWFGLDEAGTIYCRTAADNAKVRRIRNNSHVLLAPCTRRGQPLGPPVDATARPVVPGAEANAEAAIRANDGLGRRLYKRLLADTVPAVYLAITPKA